MSFLWELAIIPPFSSWFVTHFEIRVFHININTLEMYLKRFKKDNMVYKFRRSPFALTVQKSIDTLDVSVKGNYPG